MEDFNSFGLSEQILKNLVEKGYEKPTEVQEKAIPIGLENRDLVIQSQTGSGKTAAFGLPLIHRTMTDVPAVQFLVLAPTRELAYQISQEMHSLAKDTDVKVCAIYGGADMERQIKALRNGAQIVIGTPGRILDHLKRRTMSFSVVRGVVLDEADKMLSMGFLPDVQLILRHLPKRRQVVMSSATFPYTVEQLIHSYMNEPEKLLLSSDDMAPKEIDHQYCVVQNEDKEKVLLALIEKEQPELSFIFCNTKMDVKSVHFFLDKAGLNVEAMSSDLSQNQRERVLRKLRTGQVQSLVCTDLAARGIDIPGISHVFLHTASSDPETYVHRTGRTGRAGKSGKAISLVSTLDLSGLQTALRVNAIEATEIEAPSEEEIVASRVENHYKYLENIDFAKDTDPREEFMRLAEKLSDEQVKSLLPLLLEHFRRPEVTIKVEEPPELLNDDNSNDGEPRQERSRGRGRGRDRDRDRDREDDDQGEEGGRRRRRRRRRGRHDEDSRDGGEGRDNRNEREPREPREPREATDEQPKTEKRERPEHTPDMAPPISDNVGKANDRGPRNPRGGRRGGRRGAKDYTTVCVALGRLDGLDEMDLQSILRRQGRVRMDDLGDVEMKDHESFVEVAADSVDNLLNADGKYYKQFELYIAKSPKTVAEARKS